MYQIKHQIKEISVYGCGGTGSHVINGLARISHALRALGEEGIHVTAWDNDQVSHDNVGRQAFYDSDVGSNNAKVLIDRVNLYYRTNWLAIPRKAPSSDKKDLVISCVDSVESRERIAKAWQKKNTFLIDCGNARASGQVLVGQFNGDLPNIYTEHDQLILGEEKPDEPGCVDQYFRQDLFVNSVVASHALHFVWRLLRWESLDVRGVFFDLDNGISNPVKL